MIYLIVKISAIVFALRKYFFDIYNAIKTNDLNYVSIKKSHNKDYLIYLRKFSWLDEIVIMVKSNDEEVQFINSKRFNIHDIKFNNLIEVKLPDNLNHYSIIVQYNLKLLGIFKREYVPKEKVKTDIIGNDAIKILRYKIIEK